MLTSYQVIPILLAWLLTAVLVGVTALVERRLATQKGAPLPEETWPPPVETLKKERPLVPLTAFGRVVYSAILVGVPLFCFALASSMPNGLAEWQSGRVVDYAQVMLGGKVNAIFHPFTLYAMGAFLFLIIMPEKAADYRLTRLGIYMGFLLALHYTIMISVATMMMFAIMLPISAGILWLFRTYTDFWLSKKGAVILLGLTTLYIIGVIYSDGEWLGFSLLMLFLMAIYWVLPLASLITWRLVKRYEFPLLSTQTEKQLAVLWGGGWFFTWQLAIITAIDAYESLPPEPPNCYIATAASQGTPTIVGSRPVTCANGQILWVNQQLQVCKAAELALIAIAPYLHNPLRRLYDLLGRPLAQRINRPWLANCVYWSLKPFEWLAYALLRRFVSAEQIARLYR